MYYTYMIRCADNSIYTGIAKDLKARLKEHRDKDKKGAKYTKSRDFVSLEAVWESENRSTASKLESGIKKMKKEKKEKMILCPNLFLEYLPAFSLEDYLYRGPSYFLDL